MGCRQKIIYQNNYSIFKFNYNNKYLGKYCYTTEFPVKTKVCGVFSPYCYYNIKQDYFIRLNTLQTMLTNLSSFFHQNSFILSLRLCRDDRLFLSIFFYLRSYTRNESVAVIHFLFSYSDFFQVFTTSFTTVFVTFCWPGSSVGSWLVCLNPFSMVTLFFFIVVPIFRTSPVSCCFIASMYMFLLSQSRPQYFSQELALVFLNFNDTFSCGLIIVL